MPILILCAIQFAFFKSFAMSVYFVTGTDTEMGKTLLSCILLHKFSALKLKVAGMKPFAAGASYIDGVWQNEDVASLQQYANVQLPLMQVNPYLFKAPIAPHIAAKIENNPIDVLHLNQTIKKLSAQLDVLIVEGAGGFKVPLNDTVDTADWIKDLQLPVILVVGMRLGCLNHALLTVEAILQRGLCLAAWCANVIDPNMSCLHENLETLKQRIAAPLLGVIPHLSAVDVKTAANFIDISNLNPDFP